MGLYGRPNEALVKWGELRREWKTCDCRRRRPGGAQLRCRLHEAGRPVLLLEADARIGGRVKTDDVEGFQLDHGFQVLLTAYPEVQRQLDLTAMDARPFASGALIRCGGRLQRLSDPWREPQALWATLTANAATFMDKLRVAKLRRRVGRNGLQALYNAPETTTEAMLRGLGFSDAIMRHFFRPFLGGVFLESKLQTSSRMFEFVFRMFSQGRVVLPRRGMRAIPDQLARKLPADSIRTSTRVDAVDRDGVVLASGERLDASAVVLAVEGPAAAKLLRSSQPRQPWHGVTCLYFAAPRPPLRLPILVLNGEGPQDGPVNNFCVPSQVHSSYAPAEQALISATVLGVDHEIDVLQGDVLQQMQRWFGEQVRAWTPLKHYVIPFALPDQSPPALSPVFKPNRDASGVYLCGDHRSTASLQGAMETGLLAANALLADEI